MLALFSQLQEVVVFKRKKKDEPKDVPAGSQEAPHPAGQGLKPDHASPYGLDPDPGWRMQTCLSGVSPAIPETTEVVKEEAALVSPNPAPDQATRKSPPGLEATGRGWSSSPRLFCLDLIPGETFGSAHTEAPRCAITTSPSADHFTGCLPLKLM